MTQSSYSQALIWCCGSCGFVLEGGQPHMECPMCDSYREVFIDIPQQIESEVRAEFGDEINAAPARAKRRALVAEQGLGQKFRIKGRVTLPVHDARASRK